MKLYFYIDYLASPGERLALNILNSDEGEVRTTVRMQPADNAHWTCSIETEGESYIDYFYSVIDRKAKIVRREWMTIRHRLELSCLKAQRYTIYDHWIDIPENSYLYSSAFTECLHHHETLSRKQTSFAQTVRLKVRAPQLRSYQRLCVMGAGNLLGEWQPQRAVEMTEHNYHEWIVELDTKTLQEPRLEFKFVVMDKGIPMWESGDNRTITLPPMKDGDVVVYELPEVHFLLGDERVAGTLVPVFSLRTKGSFGIGDFGDLKTMIDWMAATGQRILQVLPVNDTTLTHTWTDSYPYSCISVFAFHPQYADLRQLPPLTDNGARERFAALQEELNALPQIDYERVNKAKTEYLYVSYVHEGERTMQTDTFRQFFDEEKQWLIPYAVYCSLRDKYHTADFTCWPDHQSWNERERKQYAFPNGKKWKDVAFYYYVQFVLNTQSQPLQLRRVAGTALLQHRPTGRRTARFLLFKRTELGIPHLQLGGDAERRLRLVDTPLPPHAEVFRCLSHRPRPGILPHLGDSSPCRARRHRAFRTGTGHDTGGNRALRTLLAGRIVDRTLHHRLGTRQTVRRIGTDRARQLPHPHVRRALPDERGVRHPTESGTGIRWQDIGHRAAVARRTLCPHQRRAVRSRPPRPEEVPPTHLRAWRFHLRIAVGRRQGSLQPPLSRLFLSAQRPVLVSGIHEKTPETRSVNTHARLRRLEIQAMPKDARDRFGDLARNPYRSVCTISSHDMPTLRQWWEEDWERAQTYFNTMLFRQGPAPHPLPGWLASDIILRNLMSPSMLCIIAIQDWLAIDEQLRLKDDSHERINEPANPKHYWRYRMHLNIEELLENQDYKEQVSDLIIQSGRHITNQ